MEYDRSVGTFWDLQQSKINCVFGWFRGICFEFFGYIFEMQGWHLDQANWDRCAKTAKCLDPYADKEDPLYIQVLAQM